MEAQKSDMYNTLYSLDARIKPLMENNPAFVLRWLLGGAIDELDEQVMSALWITSGSAI